ncbi:MAG: ABC transporter ATP-binding protein [Gemmatales bacterium]|nr:MAG: ABC transporter ATP-binding protein [Gemmatales bacterium]
MNGSETTLRARNVSRSFGTGATRTTAVAGVSLELRRGQFALLMGPSGSGKSTLLAMLSGLLRPDEGHVEVFGQHLWSLSEVERERFRRKHFGFIFQGFNLFPALTASQQVELVLRWGSALGRHESRRRANQILSRLGLADRADLRPAQLSGGEKQRVAIGRALVKQPAFVFADEPTSALDWKHGASVIELLTQATREQGTTVLVVSHDPRIEPYADQVFQLEDGRLTCKTALTPT